MKRTVAIAGAGILGRMLALELRSLGWSVTLIDRDDEEGRLSCSWTGAGMIAPYCELESAERLITDLGVHSMSLWPGWLKRLGNRVFYREAGSLVVAHANDRPELERLRRRVTQNAPRSDIMREVRGDELRALEPELADRFPSALYFPFERHMDNRDLMRALGVALKNAGVAWLTGANVQRLEKHRLFFSNDWKNFDMVVDCRGMGAKEDLRDLRGVRGELLYLHAPEVNLSRPVRIMHPRFSIYIVPRADHVYVVGATAIESDDAGAITVRSALELLSAAYTVHSGFAEGRLLETSVSCRPGFPDNHPRILVEEGRMAINGLYRHGFLISPALVEFVASYLNDGSVHPLMQPLIKPFSP